MTVTLSRTAQERLEKAARDKGIEPSDVVEQLVLNGLPEVKAKLDETNDPTLALFAEWEAEDALRAPEEIERDEAIWEAFYRGINEERAAQSMRLL